MCSTCCPGIDLLSYQWALEGDGEAPALAPDSSLEWRICRMDLRGGKRVEKCWWLALAGRWGVLYLQTGANRERNHQDELRVEQLKGHKLSLFLKKFSRFS